MDRIGIDGPWSTFAFRIGDPPQLVHLLPSTSSVETWVVDQQACTKSQCDPTTYRGGLFDSTLSEPQIIGNKDLDNLNWKDLGFPDTDGYYMLDRVGIGQDNSTSMLDNQVIASFADDTEYDLGLFGLGPYSVNVTKRWNEQPSFLGSLKDKGMIPSLSWGLTAGQWCEYSP